MAKKLYEESNIQAIADSIRAKGVDGVFKVSEMAGAIDGIPTGGGGGSEWSEEMWQQAYTKSQQIWQSNRNRWNGHVDAVGLAEIGWDANDIAYYQQIGVTWNEEDDDKHLVSDFDKWVATQITSSNYTDSRWKTVVKHLPKFDTSAKTSLPFNGFYSLEAIPLLDTSKVTNMYQMFYGCSSLTTIPLLDTSKVTNMRNMFSDCRSLTTIPLLVTSNVTNMSSIFNGCFSLTTIPLLDTSNVTDMSNMFSDCFSLTTIPLLDTSKVTDMNTMFYNSYALTTIPQLVTSNVTNMRNIFSSCRSLTTIPLLVTSNVTNMSSIFNGCFSLTTIPLLDTSKVTNMFQMFISCSSLTTIPLLDTSKVTSMYQMFQNCYALTTIPQLDTQNVTSMYQMFCICRSLTTIPLLDTSKVTDMSNIFSGCSSLTTIPLLDTSKVTDMSNMFSNSYGISNCQMGIKFANIISSTQKALSGASLIGMIKNANNTSAISQTLFMNVPAAQYVYEYSCGSSIESWMDANDGTQSAQTWLAAQAAKTNKPKSTYAITLSWASGSADYSGT